MILLKLQKIINSLEKEVFGKYDIWLPGYRVVRVTFKMSNSAKIVLLVSMVTKSYNKLVTFYKINRGSF